MIKNLTTKVFAIFFVIPFFPLVVFASNDCHRYYEQLKHSTLEQKLNFAVAGSAEVKTNPEAGMTAQFLGDSKQLFVRSGGFLYKAQLQGNGLLKTQELSGLKGLESLVYSITQMRDGQLWVAKRSVSLTDSGTEYSKRIHPLLESQILYSNDNGKTFSALELPFFKRKLKTDFGNFDEFATITEIREESINDKEGIVVNGIGPSAFVSYNRGKSWQTLVVENPVWETMGYPGTFIVLGDRIIFGGEHPLDEAFFALGLFDSNGQVKEFVRPQTPNLENRRIQFINQSPFDLNLLFAGCEGGLLVSRDKGNTWSFSFKETDIPNPGRENRHYPYFKQWSAVKIS
tara:strand:- start:26 stop:1057 length:1032 start_codon:yes stop_codon:yes gene_type:complete